MFQLERAGVFSPLSCQNFPLPLLVETNQAQAHSHTFTLARTQFVSRCAELDRDTSRPSGQCCQQLFEGENVVWHGNPANHCLSSGKISVCVNGLSLS